MYINFCIFSQVCGMDFVDWTYDGRFVNLLNSSSHVGLDVYKVTSFQCRIIEVYNNQLLFTFQYL